MYVALYKQGFLIKDALVLELHHSLSVSQNSATAVIITCFLL